MSNNNIPQTPEAVAYQLMQDIFKAEYKTSPIDNGESIEITITNSNRDEILNTYVQCLRAVRGLL